MRIVLVFLIIVPYAFPCERFTFEEGFDELFSTDSGFCSFIDGTWVIGTFESMNMEGFHERSAQYIYPNEQTSCISSPTFVMDPGGIIEVNIFMANQMDNDLIQVMILEEYSEVGTASQWGHDFAGGWGTIQITIVKNSQFRGIVSIIFKQYFWTLFYKTIYVIIVYEFFFFLAIRTQTLKITCVTL